MNGVHSMIRHLQMILVLGMAFGLSVACGPDERKTRPTSPTEPAIEALKSNAETVHPGDSVQLAVVAGPASELDTEQAGDAGEAGTTNQALNHDTGTTRDSVGSPRDGGAQDGSLDTRRDGSTTSDTATTSDATSGTTSDAGKGPIDARSIGTSDTAMGGADASSNPTPEPPSGDVPEDWTVDWAVTGDGWSITGQGATAELTAPDRYETTTTVTVTVSTPGGRSTSAETTVTTGSNTAPAIVNSTTRPNPVLPGDTIEATVEASDPNSDELTYRWRVADP